MKNRIGSAELGKSLAFENLCIIGNLGKPWVAYTSLSSEIINVLVGELLTTLTLAHFDLAKNDGSQKGLDSQYEFLPSCALNRSEDGPGL